MEELVIRMACAVLERMEREGEAITTKTVEMAMQVGYMLPGCFDRTDRVIPNNLKKMVRNIAAYTARRFEDESKQEHGMSNTTTELLLLLRTNFRGFL